MCKRCCSRAVATVDFPDADKPVNQMVKPRWPRNWLRSCRESDGCQVMLLYMPPVSQSVSLLPVLEAPRSWQDVDKWAGEELDSRRHCDCSRQL